eukprot:COSAG05_NODE_7249_length_837_cov_0.873984_1_plen_194_part_01
MTQRGGRAAYARTRARAAAAIITCAARRPPAGPTASAGATQEPMGVRTRSLLLLAICLRAAPTSTATALLPPASTGSRFTTAPTTPGAQVQQALSRAVSAGSPSFTLPAGVIAFGKAVFSLQAARDFALRGSPTGTTTLLFAPGGGMRVVGCSNVTVSTLTIDYDPAPFAQLAIDRVVSSAEDCCTPPGRGVEW